MLVTLLSDVSETLIYNVHELVHKCIWAQDLFSGQVLSVFCLLGPTLENIAVYNNFQISSLETAKPKDFQIL